MRQPRSTVAPTLIIATLAGSRGAPAQTVVRIEQNFVEWTQKTIDGNHPAGSDGYVDLDGTYEGTLGEINLHSDEAATVANRPTLRVIYRKPTCP